MRTFLLAVVLTLTFVQGSGRAQSTEAEIGARLIGKPLFLRGFWAEDRLSFHADGTPIKTYGVRPFTESSITVKSVRWKGNFLEINGRRNGLSFDQSGNIQLLPFNTEDLRIKIERGTDEDLQKALNSIFLERMADLVSSLPDYWQPYAREHFLHESLPAGQKDFLHELALQGDDAPLTIGGSIKPPRILHQIEPTYPLAAKEMKYSRSCQIYLWVDSAGNPEHVRIQQPAGVGIDESAVEAIRKYKFAPATRDGKPVKVELYIDVSMTTF